MAADGHLNFDTEINEKGFSKGIKKLRGIAVTGLKTIGVATGAATAAFGVLTKKSLDSVASLEQNIGGVETLFKDSAQSVIDNANKAYKTAGMSANAYMQNVTSFSASLLQSVAGNTKKAAEIADMAMVDMSDNANKMGSNMEDIQNAYQGFAKQNYTMLDNLKLGYGGTEKEMVRLINDSGILNKKIKNLDNVSFDQIIKAIHKIQENMGIAGATSEEALTTIEGSMNAAKGAFDNFLNGSGSPEALADSVSVAAENIMSNLARIVPRLISTLPQVGRAVIKGLSESLSSGSTGELVNAGGDLVRDIATGIIQSLPGMETTAISILKAITSRLKESAPRLLKAGYELLSNVVDGIVQAIPTVLPKMLDFVQDIGEKLSAAAPVLIQKGFELLQKLAQGIVSAIPILIAKVPTIISTFANIINDNFPTILMKGVQLLGQLIMGIIQAIPTLIANIPKIISAIVDTLMAFQWVNLGKTIITGLGNGIKAMGGFIKSAGTNILNNLKSAVINLPSQLANLGRSAMYSLGNTISGMVSYIKTAALRVVSGIESTLLRLPEKMLSIGKNIVKGLWNGISDMTGWIISKIKGFGNSVLNGIKKIFGIHSPSRVFRDEVGKMLALGMGIGFEKNIPIKSMSAGVENAVQNLKKDVVFTTSVRDNGPGNKPTGLGIKTDIQPNAMNFDEQRFGEIIAREVAKAMIGMGVYLEKKPIGKIMAPEMDERFGIINKRRT